ncbi:MAG TPA: SRPBCC domain-containing protein [Chitinophagaceae bacterium]|nr:SRPBCC domain-containing protein [Chitinophagaceae bacterium]
MANYDWTTFTVRVPVKATVEKLYWCWATREGIEYWFLRMSDYKKGNEARANNQLVQKGDTYRWRWHGWSDEVTEEGTILDCNGKDLFKFSFGKAGNCTVTIKKENGEMLVELIQDMIPDDEQGRHYWHLGCKTGWTFYLSNLKSLLEGGIDLRNRDEELKNVVNS